MKGGVGRNVDADEDTAGGGGTKAEGDGDGGFGELGLGLYELDGPDPPTRAALRKIISERKLGSAIDGSETQVDIDEDNGSYEAVIQWITQAAEGVGERSADQFSRVLGDGITCVHRTGDSANAQHSINAVYGKLLCFDQDQANTRHSRERPNRGAHAKDQMTYWTFLKSLFDTGKLTKLEIKGLLRQPEHADVPGVTSARFSAKKGAGQQAVNSATVVELHAESTVSVFSNLVPHQQTRKACFEVTPVSTSANDSLCLHYDLNAPMLEDSDTEADSDPVAASLRKLSESFACPGSARPSRFKEMTAPGKLCTIACIKVEKTHPSNGLTTSTDSIRTTHQAKRSPRSTAPDPSHPHGYAYTCRLRCNGCHCAPLRGLWIGPRSTFWFCPSAPHLFRAVGGHEGCVSGACFQSEPDGECRHHN
jgi:hypothetical protein